MFVDVQALESSMFDVSWAQQLASSLISSFSQQKPLALFANTLPFYLTWLSMHVACYHHHFTKHLWKLLRISACSPSRCCSSKRMLQYLQMQGSVICGHFDGHVNTLVIGQSASHESIL